jgi:hypothetical protein
MLPPLQHRLDEQRDVENGDKAKRLPSYSFANNSHINTSGHCHTNLCWRVSSKSESTCRADGFRWALV